MHMRARRDIEHGTRWWARLAGVISGLAGLGIAGLASWMVAPAGSPVPAVGELIINLLPGPLVNFGKETLGKADKPVLLAIIVIAVLILCALAGQFEWARRFGGAVVFAVVAVLGIIGIAAQPGVSINAYIPTVVGLLLGYMILSTLIAKLRRWRPRRAAPSDVPDSQARRNFLGWTAVVGALAAAAAIGGQLLAGAATAVSSAREKLKLPTPRKPAPAIPAGADLKVDGLAPYVTANDDFYRIDTALQVPVINPDEWTLKITGMVEHEVDDQLRRPDREATGRAPDDSDLRLQQRGWRPDRQRALARLSDPGAAGRGQAAGWQRHGAVHQRRRLDRRYAVVGTDRPGSRGHPGHRDEW